MDLPHRYRAYWLPLNDGIDQRRQVARASRWLKSSASGAPLVVLNAAGAIQNHAFEPIRWVPNVISTKTKHNPGLNNVYSVVTFSPSADTLQLARRYALDGDICVIGPHGDSEDSIDWWIDPSKAKCLDPNYEYVPEGSPLGPEATAQLKMILHWDGPAFVSSGDQRKITIQDLRQFHADFPNVSASDISAAALRSGLTNPKGVKRLIHMFSMIVDGRNPR